MNKQLNWKAWLIIIAMLIITTHGALATTYYNSTRDFLTTQNSTIRYMYQNQDGTYVDMSYDAPTASWKPSATNQTSWNTTNGNTGTTGGLAYPFIVIRYTVPSTQKYYTSLSLKKSNGGGGDGFIVEIQNDANQSIKNLSIGGTDTSQHKINVIKTFTAGDDIYFKIESNSTSNYDTFNATEFIVSDNYLYPLTAFYYSNGSRIDSFTAEVNGVNYTTTNGLAQASLSANEELINITYYGNSVAIKSYSNINTSLNNTLNASLFDGNTINFNIYYLNNLSLFKQTANIELDGYTIDYSFSTSNGTYYAPQLNSDTYRITTSSTNYSDNVIYATITSGSYQPINIYLASSLTTVTFTVKDEQGNLIPNASIGFTQSINGTIVTVGQIITDFSGTANVNLDSNTVYYLSVTKDGYVTFTGTIIPTTTAYTINIVPASSNIYTSIYDLLNYNVNYTYQANGTTFNVSFETISANGYITYFGANTTYNNTNYSQNISGSVNGGIARLNLTGIDYNIQNFVSVTYYVKIVNYSLLSWTETYPLVNIEPVNTSISGGLFNDMNNFGVVPRALFGMVIVILFISVGLFAARNGTVAGVMGLIGLGINLYFSWMPINILIVSIIAIIVMIIADNMG